MIDLILSFVFGGALCALAQILIDVTKITPSKILVLFVTLGIFVGGVGLYTPLLNLFGAGVSLPLLGFGGSLALGVREAVEEGGLIGVLKGPFSSMSAGVSLALILAFLYSLFVKPRSKRL